MQRSILLVTREYLMIYRGPSYSWGPSSHVSNSLSQSSCVTQFELITDGKVEGRRGEDREKACSSINHSILSGCDCTGTWEGEVLNGLMSRVRCRLLFFLRHKNSHAQLFQTHWKQQNILWKTAKFFWPKLNFVVKFVQYLPNLYKNL